MTPYQSPVERDLLNREMSEKDIAARVRRHSLREVRADIQAAFESFEAVTERLKLRFKPPSIERICVVLGSVELDETSRSLVNRLLSGGKAELSIYGLEGMTAPIESVAREMEDKAESVETNTFQSYSSTMAAEMKEAGCDLVILPKRLEGEPEIVPHLGGMTRQFVEILDTNVLVVKQQSFKIPFDAPLVLGEHGQASATAIALTHLLTDQERKVYLSHIIDHKRVGRLFLASVDREMELSEEQIRQLAVHAAQRFLNDAEKFLAGEGRPSEINVTLANLKEGLDDLLEPDIHDVIVLPRPPRDSISFVGNIYSWVLQNSSRSVLSIK